MPAKHWRQPGQGKNIGDIWTSRYVPATYCGRQIVADSPYRDRQTTILAEHTTDAPEQVTCKSCLSLGQRQSDAPPEP